MFGPDGRLYACQNGRKRIVAYAPDGTESVIAEGVGSNDIAVSPKGEIYFTDPGGKKVWFIDRSGSRRAVVARRHRFPQRRPPLARSIAARCGRLRRTGGYGRSRCSRTVRSPTVSAFHRLETDDDDAAQAGRHDGR